ncbi:MAG: MerR family transcriptional regulator [Clostridiales bacterium]|nr:MerR family transcriptional regulator [Clostridiales bacterium]MDR2749975.1 MerR family transcriptional regulator [Clostridiales bacterium]
MREDDLLPIGKFAEYARLNRSTLIYYDEEGIFSPKKRGKNGYRYYAPWQISTINLITYLQEFGLPLKRNAEIMQNRTPEQMIELLDAQESELTKNIDALGHIRSVLREFLQLLKEGKTADTEALAIVKKPERKIMLGDKNEFKRNETFHDSFTQFCNNIDTSGSRVYYPIGGLFESMDEFMRHPSRPDRFFALDPDGPDTMEGGEYLIGHTRGYYGQTNDLPEKVKDYSEKQGLTFVGPVYNIFLWNELSVPEHDKYLLQMSCRIG